VVWQQHAPTAPAGQDAHHRSRADAIPHCAEPAAALGHPPASRAPGIRVSTGMPLRVPPPTGTHNPQQGAMRWYTNEPFTFIVSEDITTSDDSDASTKQAQKKQEGHALDEILKGSGPKKLAKTTREERLRRSRWQY
jgi:hypothetical protein